MMYFKGNYSKEYRFIKVNPSKLKPEMLLGSFPEYARKESRMDLAKVFLSILGYEEKVFLIEESKGDVYEFAPDYDCPTFKESDIFGDTVDTFMHKGNFVYQDAFECAKKLILACEDVEAAKKQALQYNEKVKEEETSRPQWIPVGYHYVTGNLKKGYVVADQYGNEFTYIPYLDIYISRYEISRNSAGEARSIPGMRAWVNIKYKEALAVAEDFDPTNNSSLLHSFKQLEEAINMACKVAMISYPSLYKRSFEVKTGSRPDCMVYNIDCLTGNHYCMLKANRRHNYGKKIGGSSYRTEDYTSSHPTKAPSKEIGFRICLKR